MNLTTIIVCVEFSDFLSVALRRNRDVIGEAIVVTDPEDESTIAVAGHNDVNVLTTKVFYDREAMFNKWSAVNQAFDYVSPSGWCLILDADLLLPKSFSVDCLRPGNLYQCRRAQVPDWRTKIEPEKHWKRYRKIREIPGGHFHLFHTDDLRARRPPYSDRWRWCGSGDVEFQSRWPESLRPLMPFDAVHLGQPEVNWCGRSERYFDGSLPERGPERLENMRALRRQLKINAGLDDKYQGDRI